MKSFAIVALGFAVSEALMHKRGSTVHQKMINREASKVAEI